MAFHGNPWNWQNCEEVQWNSTEFHENHLDSMCFHKILWYYLGFHGTWRGCIWNAMVFCEKSLEIRLNSPSKCRANVSSPIKKREWMRKNVSIQWGFNHRRNFLKEKYMGKTNRQQSPCKNIFPENENKNCGKLRKIAEKLRKIAENCDIAENCGKLRKIADRNFPPPCIKTHRNPGKYMGLHANPSKSIEIHGNPEKSIAFHGSPRKSTKIHEIHVNQGKPREICGNTW